MAASGYSFIITCDVVGANEFIAKCGRAIEAVDARAPLWVEEAANIVKRNTQAQIRQMGLVDEGNLYLSGSVVPAGREAEVKFGGGEVDYAAALEFGAPAHEIRAKNYPNLYFYWERLGDYYSGPKVNHPGNKPYGYMRSGARTAMPSITALIGIELMNALSNA